MEESKTNIPEGYSEISLGDVLKYEQPYKYAVTDTTYNAKSGIPVLTAGKSFILGYTNETENVYSNFPVIIFDDFTTDSKFVDFPFKVKSSAMKFLKPKNGNEHNINFFFEIIQSLRIRGTFADHKRRWISEFSKIKTPAPPFNEQTKIASILSKADAAIAQTEALIAKYQRIKTGLMQDLLTKGIDKHGNIRNEKTHRFKTEKGLRVPEEWSLPCFGDIIELVHGYQFRNYDFTIHGLPVVKISQVKPEGLDMSSCSFIAENRLADFEKQRIKNGDVLMALTGATLGKACLVQSLVGEALQNYRVGRFEPLEENDVDKTYLYYVLTTKEFLNQIFNKVNAGAQGNIGKADFEKAFISKPPYNEQVKIAKTLLQITSVLEKEIEKRNKLQSLKTGLMQDLLSGKVRVKIKENANTTA